MKIFNALGRAVKPFVDVPAWMGFSRLKQNTSSILSVLKALFVPEKAEGSETFEEALERLGLTEADIEKRHSEFKRLFIIFLLISLGIFIYTAYLVFVKHAIHGSIAGFALTLLALTQAFRYHFWLFQIRVRRLGCTMSEWFNSGFLERQK